MNDCIYELKLKKRRKKLLIISQIMLLLFILIIWELLAYFKLNASQKLNTLSRGNAAKVSLILGLSLNTDYILLDEPFLGIDLFAKEKIRELFSTHFLEGRGILLTTHEIDEVEHLIDRVVILNDGVIAQDFYTETVRIEEGKSVIDKLREVQEGCVII